MDISRLRRGEQIAGVAGVLLLIDLWLKWYGLKVSGVPGAGSVPGASLSAWEAFGIIDLILFLTVLAAVGSAVLTATQRSVALPVAASVVVTGLGALATLLVLFRLISPPGADFLGASVDATRSFGVFAGLILTGAIAYGGFTSMQEEGTSFGEAADSLRSGGGGTPPAAPPPPPAPPAPPTGSAPPPGP
jgi:hypothetical protein